MLGRRTSVAAAPGKDEKALLGEQIRQASVGNQRIGLPMTVEGDAALDADADFVAHRNEVADRAEMDVGRFVPWISEQM